MKMKNKMRKIIIIKKKMKNQKMKKLRNLTKNIVKKKDNKMLMMIFLHLAKKCQIQMTKREKDKKNKK